MLGSFGVWLQDKTNVSVFSNCSYEMYEMFEEWECWTTSRWVCYELGNDRGLTEILELQSVEVVDESDEPWGSSKPQGRDDGSNDFQEGLLGCLLLASSLLTKLLCLCLTEWRMQKRYETYNCRACRCGNDYRQDTDQQSMHTKTLDLHSAIMVRCFMPNL